MAPTEMVRLDTNALRARATAIRPRLEPLLEQFEAREFRSAKGEKLRYRLFKATGYDHMKSYGRVAQNAVQLG